MRVQLILSALLLAGAAPALAHEGHESGVGLHMTDLVTSWNPLTQSQEFAFTLYNDAPSATGALFGQATLIEGAFVQTVRVGSGQAPDTTESYVVSIPLRISAQGCISVFGTALGSTKFSNEECAISSGLTQAPAPAPEVPEDAPETPETPEAPEAPTVPEDPTTLIPEAPPTLP